MSVILIKKQQNKQNNYTLQAHVIATNNVRQFPQFSHTR